MTAPEHSPELRQQLNDLEQANLIRVADALPELAYMFRHALIHDSAYQSLVRADRRRVHLAAGETLEALYLGGGQPAALAPQLARHFEEAGDEARALSYYTLAGDAALALFANSEAVGAFTSALACAERSAVGTAVWEHLYSARGRALELNSQFPPALANYEAMAQRGLALGDGHLALAASVAIGQLYATATMLFDPPQAERLFESARAQARALGDEAVEAKILWNQINLYRFTHRPAAARASGEQALALARRLGLKDQEALAANDLIHVYTDLGLWAQVEASAAAAERLWAELGNTAMLADSLSTSAFSFGLTGQFERALRLAQEAQRLSLTISNLWGQAYSLAAMGWPYWQTGHPDRALETTETCIAVGRLAGYLGVEAYDHARLAHIYEALGVTDRARALAEQALAASRHTAKLGMGTATLVLIRLDLRAGRREALSERLATIPLISEEAPHWEAGPLLQAQAEVALVQGEAGRALEVTQAHVAQVRELGLRAALPEALTGLARALLMHGRAAEARAQLAAALSEAQAMGAAMTEWAILYALGQLEAAHGPTGAAEPHWARAREIVSVIAARVPTAELRQSFLARPELRALFGGAGERP